MADTFDVDGSLCAANLAIMLKSGNISKTDHDILVALLQHDKREWQRQSEEADKTVTIRGNITFTRTVSTSQLSAASRCLNVSEILLIILRNLDAETLITRVQLVCRHLRSTIQNDLKRETFRSPDFTTEPKALPQFIPGLLKDTISKSPRPGRRVLFFSLSRLAGARAQAAARSSTLRNTYVCQPPLVKLKLLGTSLHRFYLNRGRQYDRQWLDYQFVSSGGIKYGDIFDALDEMEKTGVLRRYIDGVYGSLPGDWMKLECSGELAKP